MTDTLKWAVRQPLSSFCMCRPRRDRKPLAGPLPSADAAASPEKGEQGFEIEQSSAGRQELFCHIMKSWLAYVLHLAAGVAILTCFALPAEAQEDRGISSRLISRCAGKFGATLRAGDQAFPLFSLDGAPWIKIEHAERTVGGVLVADTVTGTGSRLRRRGEVVGFRYTCLVDAKGTVVGFDKSDLLPERNEALPPATLLRGGAFYRPDMQLPRGAELRVQLLDVTHNPVGDLLTEVVVRSSWVQPTPFVLRLPSDTGLENRKPVIMARLVVDSKSVRQLKAPRAVLADELHKPLILMLEAVEQPTN